MDYWHLCDVKRWASLAELQASEPTGRYLYFTTKTSNVYWNEAFRDGDFLVFGRESRGLPESLLRENAEACLTIPMQPDARSLNLATSVGIALYEAKRQIGAAK
jgi:tRNA (cytidine/uridine-2'-O-)-methyltransferase